MATNEKVPAANRGKNLVSRIKRFDLEVFRLHVWTLNQPSLRTTERPKEQFHSPSDLSPHSRFYKQTKCVHVLFDR